MKSIPNDLILFLSGASCVGKTTIAHRLLELNPMFRNVSEVDILRTVARSVVQDIEYTCPQSNQLIHQKYAALFESTKNGDFMLFKQQAAIFINAIREIVKRQQMRKIPTIIEGINIIPSLYFDNYTPLHGFQHNIIFVNLYLSNQDEHIQRRKQRCKDREYHDDMQAIIDKVGKIRQYKNYELHQECLDLAKNVGNVKSIDTAKRTIDELSHQILDIIFETFD